jgi:hypothetical protein
MKILFLTTILPIKTKGGGEIVSKLFVDNLSSLGYTVDVFGYLRTRDESDALPLNMHLVKKIVIESSASKLFTLVNIIKSYLHRCCFSAQKYITKEYVALLKKHIVQDNYSWIIIDHFQMGWVLDFIPPNMNVISISHNVESDLYVRLSEENHSNFLFHCVYKREANLMRLLEAKIFKSSQLVWLLTESNKKRYLELFPQIKSEKLKCVCIPPINGIGDKIINRSQEWDIGILGTWSWEANNRGLVWFFEEVYPLLPTSFSIRVAGFGADWLCNKYKNVQYVGFVNDANEFMKSSKVIAIPSITGDGIQIKTIQSIALGQRIVATSFALRGIDSLPSYVSCADNPTDFSQKLVSMLALEKQDYDVEADQWCKNRKKQFFNDISNSILNIE